MNISKEIEEYYVDKVKKIFKSIPEGVVPVDLELLLKLNLLHFQPIQPKHELTHYFHVIESEEKITLFNERFIVWIVPEIMESTAVTYTIIALNHPVAPHLELVFSALGVYNNSHFVMAVLEKILDDIQENELLIEHLEHK